MLEFRQMEEHDLDEVMEIEKSSFSVPWTREDFTKSIDMPSAIYLVAIKDGKIAGYCGMWCVLDEGQINNVAVANVYRGQNIGTRLLECLFRYGENLGIAAYTLEVRVGNEAAIALYKKCGFESAGVRKNYYMAPREDALIMWKYIQ